MGKMKELLEELEEAERLKEWRELHPPESRFYLKEQAYIRKLTPPDFEANMTDREMLYWLQAKLSSSKGWYGFIHASGGPSRATLDGYIAGVLGGYAMRVDPRIRQILMAVDRAVNTGERLEGKLTSPPSGPVEYHPGRPPPHKQRQAVREAKAAKAAAASRDAPGADAAGASA